MSVLYTGRLDVALAALTRGNSLVETRRSRHVSGSPLNRPTANPRHSHIPPWPPNKTRTTYTSYAASHLLPPTPGPSSTQSQALALTALSVTHHPFNPAECLAAQLAQTLAPPSRACYIITIASCFAGMRTPTTAPSQ